MKIQIDLAGTLLKVSLGNYFVFEMWKVFAVHVAACTFCLRKVYGMLPRRPSWCRAGAKTCGNCGMKNRT